ncbi:hypothetical protein R3W88_017414 [Solanum pinnatisectum]|uniref:Uncharacterized protein n=1 Tax=Solanum pinnatisectum TaxID=50273 RepID=A0AAV9L0G6_9SOLN|nr:hypothetical protein R3W88_017414 [Solanum pinnatisectum]
MTYPMMKEAWEFGDLQDVSESLNIKGCRICLLNLSSGRKCLEVDIGWKKESTNLWLDNWTNMGAVAHIIHLQDSPMNSKVVDIINNGVWNIEHRHFPEFLTEHILSLKIGEEDTTDIAIWTPNNKGTFSPSTV